MIESIATVQFYANQGWCITKVRVITNRFNPLSVARIERLALESVKRNNADLVPMGDYPKVTMISTGKVCCYKEGSK